MSLRELLILSLVFTFASCQTSKTEKAEGSERSSQPQAQGRFFPPFGGYGGFRPGNFFGGFGYPGRYGRPGGYYPGGFGGYYSGAYRPGGFFQSSYPGGFYGGYPSRPGYQGGNRPFSTLGGSSGSASVVPRPGSDNNNSIRPNGITNLSNLTPSQAALLGQALGASLRPLLAGNGAAGLGGTSAANQLADILGQLG